MTKCDTLAANRVSMAGGPGTHQTIQAYSIFEGVATHVTSDFKHFICRVLTYAKDTMDWLFDNIIDMLLVYVKNSDLIRGVPYNILDKDTSFL